MAPGSTRVPVIAGNWKMHKTQAETREFFAAFLPLVAGARHCEIVVAPPFTSLAAAVDSARGSQIVIGAQDLFWEPQGAFTGEVSAGMLVETGCRAVIVGHSERREHFGETDEYVARKTSAALAAGLVPIVCVGETLSEREGGRTEEILERQFHGAFAALTAQAFSPILVAYEPVWAIGTGRTATPELAAEAHGFLRSLAASRFGHEAAARLRILYGGSVKPANVRGLMAMEEIDGALVGGASLDAKSFAELVNYREG
jgi:triosephosphate isomerase